MRLSNEQHFRLMRGVCRLIGHQRREGGLAFSETEFVHMEWCGRCNTTLVEPHAVKVHAPDPFPIPPQDDVPFAA